MPPSRYSSKPAVPRTLSGVITKGGLETMRSKASPATGSKRDPSRTSMTVSLRAALNWVSAQARADRSVATTRSACVAKYRA